MAPIDKQDWKLISNPNALITRLQKARYFPQVIILVHPLAIAQGSCGMEFGV
jgi:hypothetical protein